MTNLQRKNLTDCRVDGLADFSARDPNSYTLNLPVAACNSVARSASEWDADAISSLDADCSSAAAEMVCVSSVHRFLLQRKSKSVVRREITEYADDDAGQYQQEIERQQSFSFPLPMKTKIFMGNRLLGRKQRDCRIKNLE